MCRATARKSVELNRSVVVGLATKCGLSSRDGRGSFQTPPVHVHHVSVIALMDEEDRDMPAFVTIVDTYYGC